MIKDKFRQYSSATYEEACEWFVGFRSDKLDEDQRRRFYVWLQEGPANIAAYLDVARTWTKASSSSVAEAYPRSALISEALAASEQVVYPFAASAFDPLTGQGAAPPSSRFARPSVMVRLAAAAAMVLCCVLGLYLASEWDDSQVYSTGMRERHFIVLNDGSTVNLNSSSRVRVHYAIRERRVALLQGQALFSVAKDPSRPFVVYSASARVKAVGTEFDVSLRDSGTVVTVIEGRVAVLDESAASVPVAPRGSRTAERPNFVSAGERLTIRKNSPPHLETTNVANVVSWTQGRLVFAATPLQDVAEEFNRHNELQIVIADAKLNQFEIDGVFSSTDVADLVQFLHQRPELEVTELGNQITVRRRQ